MSRPRRRFPARGHRISLWLLGSAIGVLPGCLVYHAVSAPVKVAAKTVVVAGEATGAVVETTGKVAVHAVRAAGTTTDAGIDAAARLARDGTVTFTDAATGSIVRVPWRTGLQFATASAQARISTAQRLVQVVRAGKLIYASAREPLALVLHSGDVVRLAI